MPAIYYAYGRNRDGTLNLEKMSESRDPSYGSYQDSSRKFYWEFRLNYDRVFDKLHRVGALIKADWSDYEASKYNQLLTAIPKRYNSYSSRFSYSYDDTYMAEFNVGYTGSEAFEKGRNLVGSPLFLWVGHLRSTDSFVTGIILLTISKSGLRMVS